MQPRADQRLRRNVPGVRAVACALALAMPLLTACAPWAVAVGGSEARDGARLSPACAAPAAGALPERLMVGGQERALLVTVPDGARSVPRELVIALHGRTNDAARVRGYTDLDDALPHAVIVYPQALPAGPGTFAWSAPGDDPDGQRDFALVEAIIDTFAAARCLDLQRVFVVGHSLGASFANDVACHFGTRVRAVASVAGGVSGGPCAAGTAAMILHHPDDQLVPIVEGERVRDAFLTANGLGATPADPVDEPALARLRCVRYGDATVPHPVVWCAHDDATARGGRHDPHTWPAGAAAAISAFFGGLP